MHAESTAFRQGYQAGLTGRYAPGEHSRFDISGPISEDALVGVIQNLCEISQEHWLRDDLLRHDAGLIAGWVVRSARAGIGERRKKL
jgi:hypothetical protein